MRYYTIGWNPSENVLRGNADRSTTHISPIHSRAHVAAYDDSIAPRSSNYDFVCLLSRSLMHGFQQRRLSPPIVVNLAQINALQKILRLSYDVIITYDNRKLLSHRKIILRFFCN